MKIRHQEKRRENLRATLACAAFAETTTTTTTTTTSGREETVAGFTAYVSGNASHVENKEKSDADDAKEATRRCAVVLLPDAVGYSEPGVRALADQFARAGYFTVCPDLHRHGSWQGDDIKELSRRGTLHRTAETTNSSETMAITKEDDALLLSYDAWCLEEWIDEHADFSKDFYNLVRFMKRYMGFDRVAAVGCGWGGRQALLAAYIEGPVPPRYKKFLQLSYYATAASDVVDGAMWTPPLVDACVALSPYVVNKVDVILGRVPALVCYGEIDGVWTRTNRNAVRDWCAEKPFLEYERNFESARFESAPGVGFGYMWRPAARGASGNVSFSGGSGTCSFGAADATAKRSTFETISAWLRTYLDENEATYRPPWMCALDGNWLGVGESKSYSYHAQHPEELIRATLLKRKDIAFSGIDREADVDWDHGWEDVESRNEFEDSTSWEKMKPSSVDPEKVN